MFLKKEVIIWILLVSMALLLLYPLFNQKEGLTNNASGKYEEYGDNIQVLVNKNSGNIDYLKGQVDSLNSTTSQLNTSVTNLTSQVQTLQNQVQNMNNAQQAYINPALANQDEDEEDDSSPVTQDSPPSSSSTA